MEWISVEDKLPEEDGVYIVHTNYGDVALTQYKEHWQLCEHGFVAFIDRMGKPRGYITHWMPLPEPPKKQEPRFSFETVEDGYVIYRRGKKLTPWYLTDSLNGDPFSLFIFLTGLDDG